MLASWSAAFPGASNVRALRGFPGAAVQHASCVAFAKRTQLAFSELQVFHLKSQHLARTQTIEEHQADESQIAIGAETLPELRNFFRREWHDDPSILFEAEAPGDGGVAPAVAERGP